MSFDTEVAIGTFIERYMATAGQEQVNNSHLPAGSPMYYYCRHCRKHTETLPESHLKRPKTVCDPCKVLDDHGLIPKAIERAKAAIEACICHETVVGKTSCPVHTPPPTAASAVLNSYWATLWARQ